MGAKKKVMHGMPLNIRIDAEDYELVKDVAALESSVTGRYISAHELIRNAVRFVYRDNERLREVFRRYRASRNRIWH